MPSLLCSTSSLKKFDSQVVGPLLSTNHVDGQMFHDVEGAEISPSLLF